MNLFTILTLLLQAAILLAVLRGNRRILMTIQDAIDKIAEDGVKLDDVSAKLTEGFNEIIALIGQLQNTTLTPEQEAIVTQLDDKATALQPQAQQIADIVPGP